MNTDQRRDLEDRVRGPEYQTSPARDQQVLNALLSQYQENRKPSKRMETIKMILHCRSVKAAVVTVTALVLIGGLWQGSGNKAWALNEWPGVVALVGFGMAITTLVFSSIYSLFTIMRASIFQDSSAIATTQKVFYILFRIFLITSLVLYYLGVFFGIIHIFVSERFYLAPIAILITTIIYNSP